MFNSWTNKDYLNQTQVQRYHIIFLSDPWIERYPSTKIKCVQGHGWTRTRVRSGVCRTLPTVRKAVTAISKIHQRSGMSDKCRNCGTHEHKIFEKFGHGRIFVVSKLLCFEVRKVEMFGLFEYLINPPKVEMPRMVKASPILFHFKFHSRSPCFYLEYISFLDWKKFLLSILLSRSKIRLNLFRIHLFTYFRCRFREKSHSELLQNALELVKMKDLSSF